MISIGSLSDPRIADWLTAGQVGVIPTDTVYGIVCRAADEAAVGRLFGTIKLREHKPGTVIGSSVEKLAALGIKPRYLKAVEQYWPGPLSVIMPHTPDYLSQGLPGIAVRIPADAALAALLERTGPLMTTSANLPGRPTATTLAGAMEYLGDTVDFYVDGGDLSDRRPSTIIRIVDDAIEVVRAGAIAINENGRIQ